jgi:hypothetical protein
MSLKRTRQTTGILFILGAILVNIPYTLLIMNFDYPDILRKPAGEILERFAAGGSSLIWTWLAFAWVGLLILIGILLLPKALEDKSPASQLALFFGAVGAFVQMVGLLRWPFVVSVLARLYTDPQASVATKEAVAAVFQAVHQYGGVVLGEHIGQLFTILWIVMLSLSLLKKESFPRWFPIMGFAASIVYALAQGELLGTAMPGFPTWDAAGLVGSLMWLAWMIALGIILLRKNKESYE